VIDSAARRARTIVEHRTFQPTVIAVILVNAVTLGWRGCWARTCPARWRRSGSATSAPRSSPLNLFIAVVVSAMEGQVMAEVRAQEEEHAAEEQIANRMILEEIKRLRAELAALRPERAEP
jgi:hypothetical protein